MAISEDIKKSAEQIAAMIPKAAKSTWEDTKKQAKAKLDEIWGLAKKKVVDATTTEPIRVNFTTPSPTPTPAPQMQKLVESGYQKIGEQDGKQVFYRQNPSSPRGFDLVDEAGNDIKGGQKDTPKPTPSLIPKVQASAPAVKGVQTGAGRNPDISRYTVTDDVHTALNTAAKMYDIPASILYDIALQESSFNPQLVNRNPDAVDDDGKPINPTGLFQFTDSTWQTVLNYEATPGTSLKLPNHDRTDPLTNAIAAAYLIKFGQIGRWTASKDNWGRFYSPDELAPYYAQTINKKNLNK